MLILFYAFLYKRNACCVKCFFSRPGLPLVISPFKKYNRLSNAFLYCIMAFQVVQIVDNIFEENFIALLTKDIKDPTGILKFLLRIVEVFIIGLRYYPLLVAFYSNTFMIYLTSALYMMIDLAMTVFTQGLYCSLYYTLLFKSVLKLNKNQCS